ncbi:zinc-ribbon domain-containing protein [Botrimarina sp.]|uniref:zinc-ribbon domain-containing protein n=1 Tax=Botrimarina sp. TaxID=2795802 RepID=UPI0032EBFD73
MSSDAKCPNCQAEVAQGMPACPQCGEKLYVEHIGELPRDGSAVNHEAFKREPE